MAKRQEKLSPTIHFSRLLRRGVSDTVPSRVFRFLLRLTRQLFTFNWTRLPNQWKVSVRCIVSTIDYFELVLNGQSTQLIPIDPFLSCYIMSIKSITRNSVRRLPKRCSYRKQRRNIGEALKCEEKWRDLNKYTQIHAVNATKNTELDWQLYLAQPSSSGSIKRYLLTQVTWYLY